MEEIKGEEEEFRNGNVKHTEVNSTKPLKLGRSKKLKRDEKYGKMNIIMYNKIGDTVWHKNEEFRNGDVKGNDVKSSKPLKLSRSKKLKRDEEYGKMIKILSKIKSLKGCYEGFIKHAKVEDIETISQCCDMLLNRHLLDEQQEEKQCILKWVKGQMEKIVKGDLSTKEIRGILEKRI